MHINILLLKLVIISTLINPHSYIPIQLTITNVQQNEVPFRLTIDFNITSLTTRENYLLTYDKTITQYQPSYSGVIKLNPKLPPGNYKLQALIKINNQPYMKYTQNFQVTDGINIQYNHQVTNKNLNINFIVQNTASIEQTIIINIKINNSQNQTILTKKEIITLSTTQPTQQITSIPLTKLPTGKYKAIITYSTLSIPNYKKTIGELQFTLKNNIKNPSFIIQKTFQLIIIILIILITISILKK